LIVSEPPALTATRPVEVLQPVPVWRALKFAVPVRMTPPLVARLHVYRVPAVADSVAPLWTVTLCSGAALVATFALVVGWNGVPPGMMTSTLPLGTAFELQLEAVAQVVDVWPVQTLPETEVMVGLTARLAADPLVPLRDAVVNVYRPAAGAVTREVPVPPP
jgi:hypothetical protein